ncbi:MAG: ROK family protein [Planctomycetota bacterium]
MSESLQRPLVGVDLGGTNMQIGVVSQAGVVMSRAKRKTEALEGRDAVLERMMSGIQEACLGADVELSECAALGIGAPGPIDPDEGVVLEAVNLGWERTPLADIMREKTGLATALDNDVNVAVYGEWVAGGARGAKDVMGVWVGTGIGGALILNGAMHYGHYKTAGEIGHMLIFPDNPPGARSFEHNCSRTALCNRVRSMIEAGKESAVTGLVEGKLHKIKSRTLAEAYRLGDELVVEMITDAAQRIGVQIAGLVTALSLEKVVLGGGLTEALGEPWVAGIRTSVHQCVYPPACRSVEVVASELEDNAGVVGAALIARDRVGAGATV